MLRISLNYRMFNLVLSLESKFFVRYVICQSCAPIFNAFATGIGLIWLYFEFLVGNFIYVLNFSLTGVTVLFQTRTFT